jgi:uncharacterized membrane protein YqgA involved in biofilm formation
MIGTVLNATAIVVGGLAGVLAGRQLSLPNQTAIKILLGAFTVYAGLSLTWKGLNGTFIQVLGQLGTVVLALMLGNLTGKTLRIQKTLNGLGQYAKQKLADPAVDRRRFNDGFVTCSVLFCVAPIAILGALFDGLAGDFKTLAAKSVMDGLATMAFVSVFGWSAIVSAIPVVAYQGTLTLLAKSLQPFLAKHALSDSICGTGGLLVFCVALVILELKKIELADYLPSLLYAPLLTWLWR